MSAERAHTGRRRNEEARRAVLEAALRLIADADGAPVGVDAIAREAGVGKQTLYRWWPSKGAVLLDALSGRAERAVPVPDSGSLREDLRAVVTSTFEEAQAAPVGPALRTLAQEAARDPRLADLMREFTQARRTALREVLSRGQERGELTADSDLDLMVDQVYGVFWYRFLLGHAPLGEREAVSLADSLVRQG
ncbi:TetR/AcrR family transcriptional regulator [Streptomyces sp. NPDC055239]